VLVAFAEPDAQLFQSDAWPKDLHPDKFQDQLEETRRLGYATSVEEREAGAAAIAAPIFNRSHKLVAALAVSGPANRLTLEQMLADAPLIVEAAKRMGKMLK